MTNLQKKMMKAAGLTEDNFRKPKGHRDRQDKGKC